MKRIILNLSAIISIALPFFLLTDCMKKEDPLPFETGTFPDTVFNLKNLNSEYDDYNLDLNSSFYANLPLIFSSNRGSEGGQFDLVQGVLSYAFDRSNGNFWIGAEIVTDPFLTKLLAKANTARNDFGPHRLYNADEGYEYLILSSEDEEGKLDFYYTRNLPVFGSATPDVEGPFPLTLLNSSFNDAYISFNTGQDTAYFSSDASGNFDIYFHKRPAGTTLNEWFNLGFESSEEVDNLNSSYDDKCPIVLGNVMVFTSNRLEGSGGYDLYYSVLTNGTWSTPVNFGDKINSSSDEYRPVLGGHADFTNYYMMFSSNRPGGEGGFDLYFTGIPIPE